MEEDIVPVLSAGGPRSGIPWHTHAESPLPLALSSSSCGDVVDGFVVT